MRTDTTTLAPQTPTASIAQVPSIPLIFIAGPYTAATFHETHDNIQAAWRWGCEVAKLGAYPVIPHTNSAYMDHIQAPKFWYAATQDLMRRCDAVFFAPGWLRSAGALDEADAAAELGMRTAQNIAEIIEFIEEWYDSNPPPNYVRTLEHAQAEEKQ